MHGQYGSMLFFTKYEMAFAPPPISIGQLNFKICQNFMKTKTFLHLCQDKPLWVQLIANGGIIFITTLLHFHYSISLETATTQKSEVFLLRNFLGNVNASVVTYRYPQIYNFSFRKEFLEILCECIYLGFWPQVLQHLLW